MTLRTRIAAFVGIVVAVSVVLVAWAGYRSASDESRAEIDAFLLGRVGLVGLIETVQPDVRPGRGPREGVEEVIGEDVVAQLFTRDGTVVPLGFTGVVLPVDDRDLGVLDQSAQVLRTVKVDGISYRMLTRRVGPTIAIQVARDLSESEVILAGIRNRLILVGLGGAALASLLGWLLAGRALRPVTALTDAAETVAATGALDAAIAVDRTDEIGRLATAFNDMLARLESSRSAQQRLVVDASHELRTPLTSLRTNIELLAGGRVPDEEQAELLADLTGEVSELGSLVGELVDLATVGRDDEPKTSVDLAEIVEEVAGRAARRAPDITIDVHTDPVVVEARPAAVTRAVANLLDNAVKWTPSGGKITVTLDGERLVVSDTGPGFEPEDLPHVFERFYRAASARNTPGSGLGLSIVAAVAEDHGWEPFAGTAIGGGGEVGLRFPGAASPST